MAGNTATAGGLLAGVENLQHFDGATFAADVLDSAQPVVVDFYADWCPPCKMMEPVVRRLADEFAGQVKIGELNTDANQDIAIRYGVSGIPTLGLFRDGKLVDRMVGFPGGPAPIRAWIEKNVPAASASATASATARNA
jgi:thioredoxin 1